MWKLIYELWWTWRNPTYCKKCGHMLSVEPKKVRYSPMTGRAILTGTIRVCRNFTCSKYYDGEGV